MSSTYTESRLVDRRNAVPLLLSSFPAPPTHIPSSPLPGSPFPTPSPHSAPPFTTFQNPPPSLPPSAPLPPVPGPSPISEQETLMFISAARSRRASKMSLASSASSYSLRDSVVTLASVRSISSGQGSGPPLSPSASHAPPLDSSTRSIRSLASNSSLSASGSRLLPSDLPAKMQPRICEEDPSDLTRMSLDELTITSRTPDLDHGFHFSDDDDAGVEVTAAAGKIRSTHRSRADPLNDSISSIDMQDLPAFQDDDDDDERLPVPSAPLQSRSLAKPSTSNLARAFSQSKLNKALPPLPIRDSIASAPARDRRSSSPDIKSILASTPKPRRKSASALVSRSNSGSQSQRRRSCSKRRVSEGQTGPFTVTIDSFDLGDLTRERNVGKVSALPYVRCHEEEILDDDASFMSDYGEYIDGTGTAIDPDMVDMEAESRLERQLEGDGSDSDSSIDMHTPLPNLMLRDGLLSPNSKLLPQSARAPSPQVSSDRLSLASASGSIMTKSGLFKDSRDTHQRRTRHRDGKLLRGGIGLTTGLGWSDSEDEDAPSPLTRRISSLILSRKSSSKSLRPSTLSRSVSDTLASAAAKLDQHQRTVKPRSSLPPTSWQHSPGLRSSTSSTSTTRSTAFGGSSARTSNATDYSSVLPSRRTSEAVQQDCEETGQDSSSSASSAASMPMPLTPADDDPAWSTRHGSKLPAKSLVRKIPSNLNLRSGASKPNASLDSIPSSRNRTFSTSSNSSVAASVGSHAPGSIRSVSTSMPSRTPIPRPLRLPQASTSHSPSLSAPSMSPSSRAAAANSPFVPKPQAVRSRTISGTSSIPSASKLARPSGVGPRSTSTPSALSVERPKPRTGTGMAYRTGSGSGRQTATAIRPPTTPLLRASATGVKPQ